MHRENIQLKNKGEPLSYAFKSVLAMQPNYDPETYHKLAVKGTTEQMKSMEVSEDAFLIKAQQLIKGVLPERTTFLDMRNILKR